MDQHFYRSCVCDVPCDHRHQTWDAAEACARKRIASGALRRYMGEHKPLTVDDVGLYVAAYHKNGGLRVGG